MKRGQVTLFVILGLVLVVAIALLVYYKDNLISSDNKQEELSSLSQEEQEIKSLVESCLNDKAKEALTLSGYQGFYVDVPNNNLDYSIYQIPYLYDNGINKVPSIEIIEEQLSKYIDENIAECYTISQDIEFGNPETKTEIQNDKVLFTLNLPVKLNKGESASNLNEFNTEVKVRLGELYAIVKTFLDDSEKDKLCLSCLLDLSVKNDIYTEVVEVNEDIVVIFNDQNSKINDDNYILQFAINYEK